MCLQITEQDFKIKIICEVKKIILSSSEFIRKNFIRRWWTCQCLFSQEGELVSAAQYNCIYANLCPIAEVLNAIPESERANVMKDVDLSYNEVPMQTVLGVKVELYILMHSHSKSTSLKGQHLGEEYYQRLWAFLSQSLARVSVRFTRRHSIPDSYKFNPDFCHTLTDYIPHNPLPELFTDRIHLYLITSSVSHYKSLVYSHFYCEVLFSCS